MVYTFIFNNPKRSPLFRTRQSKFLLHPFDSRYRQPKSLRYREWLFPEKNKSSTIPDISYNENLRLPYWVAYELTRQETQGNAKRTDRFITDPSVKGIIATNADYARSGYDKGHMAPAADMKWSNTAMKESFYFSNMCPQHPELNRRKWKDLEEKIRDWAITDSAIIIICGPIIEKTPQKIGKNKVTVPQKFFKVILSPFTTSPKTIGFLFKNGRSVSPLATYAVSVDSIETLTGMDFFAPLPDDLENKIESQVNCDQWGL